MMSMFELFTKTIPKSTDECAGYAGAIFGSKIFYQLKSFVKAYFFSNYSIWKEPIVHHECQQYDT